MSDTHSPAEKRDFALTRFIDALTSLVEMIKPAVKKAVDEDMRGK